MSDDAPKMNRAERLALAAAEAPILRNASEKTLNRRVALTDADGKVTGYTSGREVLKGLAKAHDLEHAVEDGRRPETVVCENCGKPIAVKAASRPPSVCRDEDGGCDRQRRCAEEGCSRKPTRGSFRPRAVRKRCARPWKCKSHASAENAKRMYELQTPEQKAKSRLACDSRTPHERRQALLKARTPEQRSEAIRKGHETRRKLAAAKVSGANRVPNSDENPGTDDESP